MKNFYLAFLVWATYACTPLFATTIIPFAHLGEATLQSSAVVLAVAMFEVESPMNGMIYRDMQFQVKSVVKGNLEPGQEFGLRPYSKFNEACAIDIAGDFDPVVGKTYLLFLTPHGTVWRAQMLTYYVFEEMSSGGQILLAPLSGAGIEAMARPDGVLPEPLAVYQKDALLSTLRAYATGDPAAWQAELLQTYDLPDHLAMERVAPEYCDFKLGSSVDLARWQNAAPNVYYDDTSVPAGFDATLTSILTTMSTAYTGIAPVNAGQVSYVPTCAGGSAVSFASNFISFNDVFLNASQSVLIMFEDPCDEISGPVGCSGVLAIGGSYSFSATHTFKDEAWKNSGYGYLIVNNGVPECMTGLPFILLMIHEMTHVYRMDHISTTPPGAPLQNMNPVCCNPINTLDLNCMNYAYGSALPVELSSFTAQRKGERQALLSWKTASEINNDYFTLEHATDDRVFTPLSQVDAANVNTGGYYEWTDKQVFPGLNYYRLSQTDLDGNLSNLGIRSVQFDIPASIRILPNPIARDNAGTIEINCSALFEGALDIVSPDGRIVHTRILSLEPGRHQLAITPALAAGIYRAVLRNGQQVESVGFSKL